MDIIPGNSYWFTQMRAICTLATAARGIIKCWSNSPSQSISEGQLHINWLEMLAVYLGLQTFLADLKGHHVLVCSDSMTMMSYINFQGGLSLKCLFTLVESLLVWAQHNLCSLYQAG